MISERDELKSQPPVSKESGNDFWLRMGLGLGSLIYILQALFAEVSVLTRWTVTGYPDAGPRPFPWG